MKTSKPTPPSSSDNQAKRVKSSIRAHIPQSWLALTNEQRHYLCALMAGGEWTADEVKALFLARIIGQSHRVLLQLKDDIAELMPLVDFIDQPPAEPSRMSHIAGHAAVDAMLDGVPFRTYLEVENYYQGYLKVQSPDALDAIGLALYPGTTAADFDNAHRVMLLMWLVGLKAQYAGLFPHLFGAPGSADPDSAPTDPRAVMITCLRALTGGDITKQPAVLSTPTLDALTELDAKAGESEKLKSFS